MMNQFNLSNWNYNDDSDLYESIDLITPAVRGLEELFSTVLEKFLQPINAWQVYGT
jgi:hypothetical protein